jgi:ATP-dependent DNA helicase RecQ
LAREVFGFESFRPGQRQAIDAVLAGRDTLAVLPTGSGKSLIYQLAALALDGPTVVVSPLIALQRDQVEGLAGVDTAAAANSHASASERASTFEALRAGELEFLFLAPEQLANDEVRAHVAEARPSLFVVDEAHCISSWGHDFRPDYLRLGAVIESLGHPTVLALTATASPPVREEIVERLRLVDPAVVVRGFDRPNIFLAVDRFVGEEDKRAALVEAVASAAAAGDTPGIVYTATRRSAEELAALVGEGAVAYHGGMSASDRAAAQAAFMDGSAPVVVATTAFGMGIDKPDVRFVFHAEVADSLDSYYQEIGRAGRDGEPARAVLFYRPEDLGLRRFFAGGGQVGVEQLEEVATVLASSSGPVDVSELREATGLSSSRLTAAVGRLEKVGAAELTADGAVTALVDDAGAAAERAAAAEEAKKRLEQSRVEMMRSYAEGRGCRRQALLAYFGEQYDGPGAGSGSGSRSGSGSGSGGCGNCDTCLLGRSGEVAAAEGPWPVNSQVRHVEWGVGLVLRYEGDTVVVLFDQVGYKTLSLAFVQARGLLEKFSEKSV